jgi:hypothetical protein
MKKNLHIIAVTTLAAIIALGIVANLAKESDNPTIKLPPRPPDPIELLTRRVEALEKIIADTNRCKKMSHE